MTRRIEIANSRADLHGRTRCDPASLHRLKTRAVHRGTAHRFRIAFEFREIYATENGEAGQLAQGIGARGNGKAKQNTKKKTREHPLNLPNRVRIASAHSSLTSTRYFASMEMTA